MLVREEGEANSGLTDLILGTINHGMERMIT